MYTNVFIIKTFKKLKIHFKKVNSVTNSFLYPAATYSSASDSLMRLMALYKWFYLLTYNAETSLTPITA